MEHAYHNLKNTYYFPFYFLRPLLLGEFNQIDHILIDKGLQSSILKLQYFKGAECDPDNYLVVEKFREWKAVRKHAAQKFVLEKFNLKNLSDLEVKKQYQI